MAATIATATKEADRLTALVPGLVAVAALAVGATGAGRIVPRVGAPAFAVVGGALIAGLWHPGPAWRPGVTFGARSVLKGSIVVLGTGLSIHQVARTGLSSLPVLVGSLAVALLAAQVIGGQLGLRPDVTLLVGMGTAICGASAIAATDSVIGAETEDVSYAIATIFTFNVAAVLAYPFLGHALGLSPHAFGLWSGTAINDASSVVAASTIYGHAATGYAVIVKLTRTLAIVPLCGFVAVWRARHRPLPSTTNPGGWRAVVPLFIVGFVAAVGANSLGLIPPTWHGGLTQVATWLITAALGAVGLSTDLGAIRRAGPRPLLLGALLWVVVGLTSLALLSVA